MSVRFLPLVLATVLAGGCARTKSPDSLQQPVGQSTVGATSSRDDVRDAGAATTADSTKTVENYVAGDATGPCGSEPPIIAFDPISADLRPAQIVELQRLAGCLTSGPFEKASIVLVGYTDVMGTASANLELGLARAQNVMRRLMADGVAPGRIVVASAGELQRPQASWGLDAHRVEVLLARGGPQRPNEPQVARGIDADGLMPRRPRVAPTTTTPSPTPRNTARPNAARSTTSRTQ